MRRTTTTRLRKLFQGIQGPTVQKSHPTCGDRQATLDLLLRQVMPQANCAWQAASFSGQQPLQMRLVLVSTSTTRIKVIQSAAKRPSWQASCTLSLLPALR